MVYLIVPIGSFVLKIPFKAQGEPTDPKIKRVKGGMGNLEDVKLRSGQVKILNMNRSVKYKGGFEKWYGAVMTNTRQVSKKPLIRI